jgi:hypothetical protein
VSRLSNNFCVRTTSRPNGITFRELLHAHAKALPAFVGKPFTRSFLAEYALAPKRDSPSQKKLQKAAR